MASQSKNKLSAKLKEQFRNGRISWMKGKKHTKVSKKKNSQSHLGQPAWNKGKPLSKETRKRLSASLIGRKTWNKGKPYIQIRGKKHHNWKGGVTPHSMKIRHSLEYKLWRTAVFERDNYTCIFCGTRGGRLNADHIKPFCDYPELRLAIDNGRTLCVECHKHLGWSLFKERNPMKSTTHSVTVLGFTAP